MYLSKKKTAYGNRVFIIIALLLAAVGLNAKDIDKPVDHLFPYCEIEGIKYKYDPETLTATVIEGWRVNYENVWSVNENGDSTLVERHNYVPLTQGYHSVTPWRFQQQSCRQEKHRNTPSQLLPTWLNSWKNTTVHSIPHAMSNNATNCSTSSSRIINALKRLSQTFVVDRR